MDITQSDIDIYLAEVKDAIRKNRYRIERNSRRQDNINLFLDYVIDENMAKDILLGLTATDFSEILQNEHKSYEHERLYVFGKDVELLERTGNACRIVTGCLPLDIAVISVSSPASTAPTWGVSSDAATSRSSTC